MDNRGGCLSGLVKLFMLNWVFDWLQSKFGFGKGASCSGCGCGVILLIIFVVLSCSVITQTSWFQVGW